MTPSTPLSMRIVASLALCVATLGLGACAGMSNQTRDTTIGAGVGAVAGSVLTGTTTGAAVGAVIGGVIGNQNDENKKK